MKVELNLFLLAFMLYAVYADIESCSEVADCSEAIKSKCDEMSKAAEESNGDQKYYAVLACKNGICMCSLEFSGATDTPPSEETQKRAEQPTTENSDPSS